MEQKKVVLLWRICLFAGLTAGLAGIWLPVLCYRETGQYYRKLYLMIVSRKWQGDGLIKICREWGRMLWNALQQPELLIRYLGIRLSVPMLFLGTAYIRKRRLYVWLYIGIEFLALSFQTVLLYGFGGFSMVYRWIPPVWIGTVCRSFFLSRTVLDYR